jgi:hypothetical protein
MIFAFCTKQYIIYKNAKFLQTSLQICNLGNFCKQVCKKSTVFARLINEQKVMNKQMLKTEWEKIIGHIIRNDTYILLERMSNNENYNDIIEDIEKDRSKYNIKDSYILTKEETIREYLSLIKSSQQKE